MKTKILKLDKIQITKRFKKHPPKAEKMAKKRKYVEDTGCFKEDIVVRKSGWWLWSRYTLVDGYTTYILANERNLKRIQCTISTGG